MSGRTRILPNKNSAFPPRWRVVSAAETYPLTSHRRAELKHFMLRFSAVFWPSSQDYMQIQITAITAKSLDEGVLVCPRRESNPHLRFRKPPFYPLNYGDVYCKRLALGDFWQLVWRLLRELAGT